MKRKAFDLIVSTVGVLLTVMLVIAGALLLWTHNFVGDQVQSQLAAQQIYFPPSDSPAVAGDEYEPMREYGGQQLLTGKQAQVYADHYIAVHLKGIGGGKTYAQLSTEARENPDDAELAATVDTVFRGETLRGLLLNAYAFGTMATIAGWGALVAFIAAGIMLILTCLGFWHASRTPGAKEMFPGRQEQAAEEPGS